MPNRILVVEDSSVIRAIAMQQLNDLGVNCYAVSNAEEAVDLAEFFDLVLMDVQLPGMSGIDATREIRRRERAKGAPPVPIVAVSSDADIRSCLTAGMDDFYSKPVTNADMQSIVEHWIFSRPSRMRMLG